MRWGRYTGSGLRGRSSRVSDGVLNLNEGTVYTALLRLQQQGWIASKWGTSENKRKARFYSITRQRRKAT
jgi:PadR family transcriptional regulator, regulatory protein PadR